MSDTEEQADLRKRLKVLLETVTAPNRILTFALGAASACWGDINNAGVFRMDLMEVIIEETSKRLGFTKPDTNDNEDKISIYGAGLDAWLVYNVGYHTCGGYGPESGYMHEPGCGQEPVIQMKDIQGLDEWISNYLDDDAYYLVSPTNG